MLRRFAWMSFALTTLSGCGSSATAPLPPSAIEAIDNPITAEVGAEVQLSARITNENGESVEGAAVTWSASGGGSVEPTSSTTGAEGIATTTLTVGTEVGPQSATAAAEGLPTATFSITATPGPAEVVVLSLDSLRFTAAGETQQIEVEAHDRYGNRITSPAILWTSSDGSIASGEGSGAITARGRGIAKIMATVDAASDALDVYVLPYGYFTITFDDGFESTYTIAYPALKQHGLRANVAVNPGPVDFGWTGYMNVAQLNEVHGDDWSIVNHSMTHPRLSELAAEQMEAEIREAKAWIEARGYRGRNVFIVPYHDWGPRELAVIKESHTAARGYSADPPWPEVYQPWPPADPYKLTGIEPETLQGGFTTESGRAAVLQKIETVIDRGEIVDVFLHRIEPSQAEGFRLLVEKLATKKDRFRTYHELFPD